MTYRGIFDAKVSSVDGSATFSFSDELAVGESLSSASVTATIYSGTDATPSGLLNGPATKSGGQVTQLLTGGVVGVVYLLTCTGLTSASETLVREGYLAVVSA